MGAWLTGFERVVFAWAKFVGQGNPGTSGSSPVVGNGVHGAGTGTGTGAGAGSGTGTGTGGLSAEDVLSSLEQDILLDDYHSGDEAVLSSDDDERSGKKSETDDTYVPKVPHLRC